MMRKRSTILLLAFVLSGCASGPGTKRYESRWSQSPDRDWAGPEYWANRLQDWRVRNGRLECVRLLPMRTVHLLTRRLGSHDGRFDLSVRLGPMSSADDDDGRSSAGFLIGAGAGLDYRAASLIHHSHGPSAGLYAGIDSRGRLFLSDFELEDGLLVMSEDGIAVHDGVTFHLQARLSADGYDLTLTAQSTSEGAQPVSLRIGPIDPERLIGNVALVSNPWPEGSTNFWFDSWRLDGDKFEAYPTRLAGPIIGSQHTLSRGRLKLTAQLMPVGLFDQGAVDLQVADGNLWKRIATSPLVMPGFTATFEIDDWDASRDTRYRLVYPLVYGDNDRQWFLVHGTIRKDPVDKSEIVVAVFTGNHNVAHPGVNGRRFPWHWGVWFPHADIVEHVAAQAPDFLFFSGDQVYEGASPTRADFEQPYQDYLYKWYLWYWAFGELTADIPSVAIPDDHDVYHGNVWGAAGVATPPGLAGAAAQDEGGYKLPPDWVNMVQRTQASHLPEPFDPTPVEQGIEVYYTDILYGGVSFAVIEDRKFKSAPAALLPEAEVWNGWPQNPAFDAKVGADAPGATLLGERQLAFLDHWANDWGDGTWMKALLSQTVFANVATIPDSAMSGSVIPSLEILTPGGYALGDKIANDMDSNGWPQTGRNRALEAIRKGFAVHLAGDQHLGSTIQYGVDDWGDAGYALCVPSIANFWPRRWYPPTPGANHAPDAPHYTGDHEDGFGNKMTVIAISNPARFGKEPEVLHDRAPGYGIARFDRTTRTISLAAWPRWADPAAGDPPYAGWPVTFSQEDNYGRQPTGYLPRLDIAGMTDPVVQIISDQTGQPVYTLRIRGSSFTPMIFEDGSYTIIVGEPGTERVETIRGVLPVGESGAVLEVVFH